MELNLNLFEKLCLAFGPSGFEDEVRGIIVLEIKNHADEIRVDRVGNLFAFKKGRKTPARKRLFAAHTDEVGFMVTSESDGYFKFKTLGGIEPTVILGKDITVGEERIPAVVGAKPIHLLSADERTSPRKTDSMYFDVGVVKEEKRTKKDDKTKDESKKKNHGIKAGTPATFRSEFVRFGENLNRVKCKAVDDRFGCLVLIELIKSELEYDTHFAFTVCEEIGLRGAYAAQGALGADITVVLEATTAGDIYDEKEKNKICSLGGGAVLSFADNGALYDRELLNLAMSAAKENNIAVQLKQAIAGGNDSGALQTAAGAAKSLAISLPTRYLHSPAVVADIRDMKSCLELAAAVSFIF